MNGADRSRRQPGQALAAKGKAGSLSLVVPEANSMGLALYGGESVEDAFAAWKTARPMPWWCWENDLYRSAPAQQVDQALARAQVLVVLDHQRTATAQRADLVLPAASFAEGDGTLVSQEGRAQRFFQVYEPSYYDPSSLVREGWRWLHALRNTGQPSGGLDPAGPCHRRRGHCRAATGRHPRRRAQRQLPGEGPQARPRTAPLQRPPSMRANLSVHEPRAPQDADTPSPFSMEGYAGSAEPRQQIPFAWSPGWNSPQAWNKFQDEVGGHLRAGDPGVRLIENQGDRLYWFAVPAAAVRGTASGFQAVPLYHLFGSEETSSRAEPVRERSRPPTWRWPRPMPTAWASKKVPCCACRSPVRNCACRCRSSPSCPAGLVGLPAGFEGIPVDFAGLTWKDCRKAADDRLTPTLIAVVIGVLKAIVILLAVVICGALLSFVERRLLGPLAGPPRSQPGSSPFGAFQLGADMLKMFFKEDWDAPFADKMIFALAPVIAMGSLLVAFSVIPDHPHLGRGGPEHRPVVLLRHGRRQTSMRCSSPAGRATTSSRCWAPCAPGPDLPTRCSWVCR